MLTLPYKRITIPSRNPISITPDSVKLDLSAFLDKPDPDAVIVFSKDEDGAIKVDLPQKLSELLSKKVRSTTFEPIKVHDYKNIDEVERLYLVVFDPSFITSTYNHRNETYQVTIYKHLVQSLLQLPDQRFHPYDLAVVAMLDSLSKALRSFYAPPRKKDGKSWLWQHLYTGRNPVLYNYALLIPELKELCQKSYSMRSLIESETKVVKPYYGAQKLTSIRALIDEYALPTADPHQSGGRQPGPLTDSEYQMIRTVIDQNLIVDCKRSHIANLVRFWIGDKLNQDPIQTFLENESDLKPALQALLQRTTNQYERTRVQNQLSYLLEQSEYRDIIRRAYKATATETSMFNLMTAQIDYRDYRYGSYDQETKDYQAHRTNVLDRLKVINNGKSALELATTSYSEEVPDSEQIEVSLIGDLDKYGEDLIKTGAFFLVPGLDYSYNEYKLRTTRYILKVTDKTTGCIIGYLFMTDYFKTNFSWMCNETLFRQYYGKIRYRVSVIRKKVRILEELDIDA